MSKRNEPLRAMVRNGLAQGLTFAQIAEMARCSRSAVAGCASRMGLTSPRKQTPKEEVILEEIPNDPPLAGTAPVSLLATTGCRWPVEGGFCNHSIYKKSYCAAHYAKAYRTPEPVHPLLVLLSSKGPQTPKTKQGAQAYNMLLSMGLVMYRINTSGLRTFYLTENTPGY